MQEHVAAANPYAHQPPHAIGLHMSRISRAIQHSNLQIDDHILDMGCGWGLSSQLLAFSGLRVTALDINPLFVQLVRQRAEVRNLKIKAVQGTFEKIPGDDAFHAAIYYECLHHAVKPWETLTEVYNRLRPSGKLILAGEPINNMWKDWGIRLACLSIALKSLAGLSGWSFSFIVDCLKRCRSSSNTARMRAAP